MKIPILSSFAIVIAAIGLGHVDVLPAFAGGVVPEAVCRMTSMPDLPWSSFYYGARYNTDGRLYLWDGSYVWRQDGVNVDAFTKIGEVQYNMADAGPIQFSRDGTQILLGNGAGGRGPGLKPSQDYHAGRIFSMPIDGGEAALVGDIDYHYDIVTIPKQSTMTDAGQKYFVDYGWQNYEVAARSWVSVYDASTQENQVLIDFIPGASAAMAIDNQGNLCACIGLDNSNPDFASQRGLIKRFDIHTIDEAYEAGETLSWDDGVAINAGSYNNQSGAGMFFDERGYLFAGGNEGLTVFRPDGTSETFNVGQEVYSSIAYNAFNDQLLVMTTDWRNNPIIAVYNAGDFLPVPEPSSLLMLGLSLVFCLWRKRQFRLKLQRKTP